MKLLCIDTSTEACSAAIYLDGEIIEDYRIAPRQHAELILPMIEGLLTQTSLEMPQLDALAFGRGPGAFTGIRIATGVIQGLSLGTGLPVVGISTLAAMAQDSSDQNEVDNIHVAIDARMNEIYTACYSRNENDLMRLVDAERVCPPQQACLPEDSNKWFGAGTGWASYAEILQQALGDRIIGIQPALYPRASAIAKLAVVEVLAGRTVPAEQALPIYLRDQVTHVK